MNRHYKPIMRSEATRVAYAVVLTILLGASMLALAVPAHARIGAVAPPLGTAGSFGVLAGSAVTNTGPTNVMGDLGVSPGSSVTGFPPGVVAGTIHAGDSVAAQAQSDATIAYNNAAGQSCDFQLTGQDLGGLTLTSGVYCFDSSAQLTGQLTLNGQGNPNSVFIFRIGSTITTASNASVSLIGNAQPCDVFWQVGSSATLGTGTHFQGNLLALTSITLITGATSSTGMYALNGAVTLDSNTISACGFAGTPTGTPTVARTATNTRIPNTRVPAATNTPTAHATATPMPTNTAVSTATSVPTGTAVSTSPPSSTTTLSSPTASITLTPGGPLITQTATSEASGTPTQTLATQTPVVTPPLTPGMISTVTAPGPPLHMPPTGGGGFPWLGSFIVLVSTLLLAAGLGMRKHSGIQNDR